MISVLTPSIRSQYLYITESCLKNQTFQDYEWLVEIGLPHKGYDVPKAMNLMLKRAQGQTVVILQDCISIPDNFLEHISKQEKQQFITYPIRKENTEDWRKERYGEIQPQEWESDLASAPLKAFFDIGGYDETYCQGWSWENVEVAYRARQAGYTFFCDNRVIGSAIDHDKILVHPFRNKNRNNDWRAQLTLQEVLNGNYKKSYL